MIKKIKKSNTTKPAKKTENTDTQHTDTRTHTTRLVLRNDAQSINLWIGQNKLHMPT
eukprot:m.6337 g.6337  ORF g.6337 m.6337 type:complete len:57 (-) comp4758_c0_seq1:79-249(-)